MSAVAALAVTSPFAVIAVSELASSPTAPQQHDFVQASVITDLPNELMSALSQGLSQFGINLPPLPTGLSPSGTQPIATGLGTDLGTGLTSPALTPGLGTGLTSPALTPGLTTAPALTPGLTTPATTPLTGTDLTNPALTPALTSPLTTPSVPTAPGLTIPPTSPDPALTLPATTPGLGLPTDSAISAPLDQAAGTYPILGDPSLLTPMAPASTGSTGIIGDLTSAAQQLGVGQVVDLLKGVVMPGITSAMQQAAPAAAAAVPAATG